MRKTLGNSHYIAGHLQEARHIYHRAFLIFTRRAHRKSIASLGFIMLYIRIAPSSAYGWITRPSAPFNPDNRHGNAAALCYKLNEPSLINAQLEFCPWSVTR